MIKETMPTFRENMINRLIASGLIIFLLIATNDVASKSIYQRHLQVISSDITASSDNSVKASWSRVKSVSSNVTLDPTKIIFQEIVSGISNPIFITHANDNSKRIFIVERSGKILIVKNGDLLATPFLDIQAIVKSTYGEQGLLGLSFHPSYATNGKFYVVYTAPRTGDANGSVLTLRQYSVSVSNPDIANSASGTNILTIDHPAYSNHNGGTIAFGNDGYLYWSVGDGGGGGDPNNNAQNLASLLGKILRIDVNTGSPYSVPASNPFYNSANSNFKKEIWAYGVRNPWRISFDRLTHDLYIGDVGQSTREEVDFQVSSSTGGENYGWRIMEGSLCYNPATGCDQVGKVLPMAEYDHTLGCSITGGYVYRGSNFPSLSGHYLYGDFCSGRIFSIFNDSSSGWSTPIQLADTNFNITSFGEDENGELYLADYATGKIYNIQYDEPDPPTDITLSHNIIDENMPVNSEIGDFSTTDPDVGDTFIYSFCGGADDASFQINGFTLESVDVFDYENRNSYSICIRSTDNFNLSTTKLFTIFINNIDENAPPLLSYTGSTSNNQIPTQVARYRFAKVNMMLLVDGTGQAQLGVSQNITINLFDDTLFIAAIQQVSQENANDFSWIGSLNGTDIGQVIMTLSDGILTAQVNTGGEIYQINSLGNDLYLVAQIDQSSFPDDQVLPPPSLTPKNKK